MPFPARVFCDTSFFYACLDPGDANHDRAEALVAEAVEAGCRLYTTWGIVGETVTLSRYRLGFRAALAFLDEVKPVLHIVRCGERVKAEAETVFRKYGRDHRLSFCDALSFVVVTTLLDRIPCLAFDRDFRNLGLRIIP